MGAVVSLTISPGAMSVSSWGSLMSIIPASPAASRRMSIAGSSSASRRMSITGLSSASRRMSIAGSSSTSRHMSIAGSSSTSRRMSIAGSSSVSSHMSISDAVAPAMASALVAAAPLQSAWPPTVPAMACVQQSYVWPTFPAPPAEVSALPSLAANGYAVPVKAEDTGTSHAGSLFSGIGSDDILPPGSTSSTLLPDQARAESPTSSDTSTMTPLSYIDSIPNAFSDQGFHDDSFPVIQGLNRHELFEIVHPETLREWEAVPPPKLIVFIANDTVTKEVHHRVVLIRKALEEIFPDAVPIIGSSDPATPSHLAVFPFLVHRIPGSYAHILVAQRYWSCTELTFFALDFSPPPTSFVMTLEGLHLPATLESEHVVEQLVQHKLFCSPSITRLIDQHRDNLPPLATARLIESVMGTIKARSVNLGKNADDPVVFNIYIHPPMKEPLHHQTWLREIRSITYFTHCGTGKAALVFHCNVCKGRDHSSPSCPFPAGVPVNLGAAPASNVQTTEYSHHGLPRYTGSAPPATLVNGVMFYFNL